MAFVFFACAHRLFTNKACDASKFTEFLTLILDDKDDPKSEAVLEALETIDDDCDRQGIILVKLDNPQEAAQYGIDEIPSLVYFDEGIPHLFEGNLGNENEVLGWLIHQMKHEEIEQVTDEMIDLLILEHKYVAVLFCKYFRYRIRICS